MHSTISPEFSLKSIDKELDLNNWSLEHDKAHIKVYSKHNVSDSDIIGFKTITEHAVATTIIFDLLKDVCGAMNQINDMFLSGETFDEWPTESDHAGSVVRTSFKMPFPMSNREFLHGLHSYQKNETTFIVAYTPLEESDIPVQPHFIRCPMNVSGQRITILNSGLVRVEHLMTYRLGGAIGSYFQDKWLKKPHISAYIKEWENLRDKIFPPKIHTIDPQQLKKIAQHTLSLSSTWQTTGKPKYGTVKVGNLSYLSKAVFRLDLEVDAPIEKVVKVLADESLKYLPEWNSEYMNGEILETIEETQDRSAWLIRVHYKTPFFLANREYVYYFSRESINKDEVLILYCSIDHKSNPPDLFVRALLYPSIHRCLRLKNGRTKIEHVLATDLKGKLGTLQNSFLKRGLIKAQCSDMEKQYRLLTDV